MPTKLNKSGKQQEYVPAGNGETSGQYLGDNNGSSSKSETTGNKNSETTSNKSNDGIKKLSDLLSEKLVGMRGTLPDAKKIIKSIQNADGELGDVICNLFDDNPHNIYLHVGSNFNDENKWREYYFKGRYRRVIDVFFGLGCLKNTEGYSEGGVFFHESGHTLDSSYDDFTGLYSYQYVSEKYQKTLGEMIKEEITSNLSDQEYNKLITEYNNERYAYSKNEEFISNRSEIFKMSGEIAEIKRDISHKDPNYRMMLYDLDDIRLRIDLESKKDNPSTRRIISLNEKYKKAKEEINTYEKEYLKNDDEKREKIDHYYNITERNIEIEKDCINKAYIKYGDISDMCQANLGDGKSFCFGHDEGYFDSEGYKASAEAFAEIMSAKATNKESLSIMKKYIPKTLEIFDEIISQIKKGKK